MAAQDRAAVSALRSFCVLALVILACDRQVAPTPEQQVALAEETSLKAGYFSPKTSLDQTYFVFADDNRLYAELASDDNEILNQFLKDLPDFASTKSYLTPISGLAAEYIEERLTVREGDTMQVCLPAGSATQSRPIVGLCILYHDVNGTHQLMADLGEFAPGRALDPLWTAFAPIGIAIKGATEITYAPYAGARSRDDDLSLAQSKMLVDEHTQTVTALSWEYFDSEPDDGMEWSFAEVTRIEHRERLNRDDLACFYRGNLVPFKLDSYEHVSWSLEYHRPEACGEPWYSEVYVLPDIDGNGLPEILIRSEISQFFAGVRLDGRVSFDSKSSWYFGP